jgi:TIR domain
MAKKKIIKYEIFVSYSRTHEPLVTPLVKLLKVGSRTVFQDVYSIKPGQRWADEIEGALGRAKAVVIIWCWHASESEWLIKEARMALDLNKEVIPVLLDRTPLPPYLEAFQWIDLSQSIHHEPRTSSASFHPGSGRGHEAIGCRSAFPFGGFPGCVIAIIGFIVGLFYIGSASPTAARFLWITGAILLALVAFAVPSLWIFDRWERREWRKQLAQQGRELAEAVMSRIEVIDRGDNELLSS